MKKIIIFVVLILIVGCKHNNTGSTVPATFNLACDTSLTYTPRADPIVSVGAGTPTTTVVALHGKSGTPTKAHMQQLAEDLSAKGYNVVMPYLPWTSLQWDGGLCDSMSYINSLVKAEQDKGNSVVLAGHSMAGPTILSYAALENTTKPDALLILAPGHFVPNSSVLAGMHASSIQLAKDMIKAGQGDTVATFQTSDYNISATPKNYLSFHDTQQLPDQYPDLVASISRNSLPTLWLAGRDDSLTVIVKNLGFIDQTNNKPNYTYKEVPGDHLSMVGNSTDALDPWYRGL